MIQYLILAVGVLLILSNINISAIGRAAINFGNSIKNVFSHIPTPHMPDIKIPQVNFPDNHEHGLVELVQQWETLKQSCIDNNLTDAVKKLDEIFPTLIKPQEKGVVSNEKS
jgi:hypothetical protein